MTAALAPAGSITETGLPWPAVLPGGWQTLRLKYAVSLRKDRVDRPAGQYIGLENIAPQTGSLDLEEDSTAEGLSGVYKNGDVLFGRLRPYLAKVAAPETDGTCSTELFVLEPRKLRRDYLKYLLLSDGFVELVNSATYGVKMPRADWGFVGNIRIPVPPEHFQLEIGRTLDAFVAFIDELIGKLVSTIALQRTVAQRSVERLLFSGFASSATKRRSRLPYAPEIPRGWFDGKLGYFAVIQNGSTPRREVLRYWQDGSIPWLTSGKVHEGAIESADQFVTEAAVRECHLPLVPRESILVAITGEGRTRGVAAILRQPATINQHVAAITPDKRLRPTYLWRVLQSQYEWLRGESAGGGSTRAAITCEFLRHLPIPVPPLEEQDAICQEVEIVVQETEKLDSAVAQTLQRLRAYRRTVISQAVVGLLPTGSLTWTRQ